MDLGTAHVVAAAAALVLGAAVLVRRKGDGRHALFGRMYLVAMLSVSVPVLFVYDMTGSPGPFHVLAVVSLVTTGLGWSAVRRRGRSRSAVAAHGTFMVWSWIGVVTAGLAQLANHVWPQAAPWPVLVAVTGATAAGAATVPRVVARASRARAAAPADPTRPRVLCG